MTKAAIVTDLHFGARMDNTHFDKFFELFYSNTFFPYLDEHNIKTVFILGDIFDRRKYINFNILNNCKRYFFDKLWERDIHVIMITGNHDVYFKNTNNVNSLELLLGEYQNMDIYTEAVDILWDEQRILLVPWITADNQEHSLKEIAETKAKYCFGHFELSGFSMYKGQPNEHGMDRSFLDKFDLVLSGHYHHKSDDGTIFYLGNPYEISWADFEDLRGFHVFEKGELTFVPNHNKMFHKIYYDDLATIDASLYKDKHVKLIVLEKNDVRRFDAFVSNLYAANPLELKILEDFEEFQDSNIDESVDVEDTMSLLGHYVDGIATDMDKPKIKTILKTLYIEALEVSKE